MKKEELLKSIEILQEEIKLNLRVQESCKDHTNLQYQVNELETALKSVLEELEFIKTSKRFSRNFI